MTARYRSFLEGVMTPKRLDHSLRVMGVMGELAEVYDLDPVVALTAGILHDAAKDLPPAQQAELLHVAKIEMIHACDHDYAHYLHGPVGAALVERELGLTDPIILAAIATHTYSGHGPLFDHLLCWCLRFAGILEPGRDWSSGQGHADAPAIDDGKRVGRRGCSRHVRHAAHQPHAAASVGLQLLQRRVGVLFGQRGAHFAAAVVDVTVLAGTATTVMAVAVGCRRQWAILRAGWHGGERHQHQQPQQQSCPGHQRGACTSAGQAAGVHAAGLTAISPSRSAQAKNARTVSRAL